MIQPERIRALNDKPARDGRYVLYWMQAAQRVESNHALEYAIRSANDLGKPLVVFFGLTDDWPEANERHYYFMLEGLEIVRRDLETRGIQIVIRHKSPDSGAAETAKDAALVVVDAGHLRIQKKWRANAARRIDCPMYEVETNLIVPVEEASSKENFSAGTFRPRITKQLDRYLVPLSHTRLRVESLALKFSTFDIDDIDKVISKLDIDRSVPKTESFRGGTSEAKRRLHAFLRDKLDRFAELRNDPTADYVSHMSPYLHFGQISPLYIALKVLKSPGAGRDSYLEELIVRRELSHNFVYYNNDYDKFACLPPWALNTLTFHRRDKREYVYSLEQFERAQTHDSYWNAAQQEMVATGKMHGYMRMYWGKKILEWSRNPRTAFKTALYLNNKYELDGRDPNAFAGVAWCFGKHDRAWGERPVFGKIRYMNAAGLKRKFDADAYVEKARQLTERYP
ncbi:MAG: deoxyribodipyrimidine photolyase [Phycisphaerae bacterium SG8_4]|nr:MAG: deoxyribodipyrimidine photolyase [Phycisphaerae bacterium SG8_4]